MSWCVVSASFCHSFSSTASAISGMLSLRRVLTASLLATCDPARWGATDWQQMSGGFIWGDLLAMQTNDRELVPPSAGRFGFACPFSEGKKAAALCS